MLGAALARLRFARPPAFRDSPLASGCGLPTCKGALFEGRAALALQVMLPFYESLPEDAIEGLAHDRDFDCPRVLPACPAPARSGRIANPGQGLSLL